MSPTGDHDAPQRPLDGPSRATRSALYQFAFWLTFAAILRLVGAPRQAFVGLVIVAAIFALVRRSLLKRRANDVRSS